MKFVINRNTMLPALSFVSSVVERRQTLPILSNVFFNIEDGRLVLVGSDLEVEVTRTIDGVECENGSFTVLARTVTDIVRMLPDDAQVSFSYENRELSIESGKSRYKLKTLPAEDYPRIQTEEWEERFKVEGKILKAMLEKTSFAMAQQDVRYYLNGVSLSMGGNELMATATDGHRLARTKVPLDVDLENEREIILPRKAVFEISKIFDGNEDSTLTLEYSRNHMRVTGPDTVLITKLIDGKFPQFDEVVSIDGDATGLSLDRRSLIEMLSRVSVLTTDRFKGIRMILGENRLKVTANTPEQEQAVEEMEVEYDGPEILCGYNVIYLLDAAKTIETEKADVLLDDKGHICYFRQPGDEHSLWLVMPMRI
ncbi:MAG: DNA polymerase III subunit beta [Gammaproteobacteria bacterium]|nr:DNA polymerase III subunit beta [Gammaproteobacteria bacterium]MYD75516.1 DNA polymerase III subunit beta [Gammaproteobacteria bacterium]